MPNQKPKRRLFNIKTNKVSLVDVAANLHSFLIIKRKDGGIEQMDEYKEILEKIEKALNDLGSRQDALEKSIKDINIEGEIDLKKVGAKFSKATMAQLKAVYNSIGKILGEIKTEKDDDTDEETDETKKSFSSEEVQKAIAKGFASSLPKDDDGNGDVDKKTAQVISAVVVKALEALKGAEKE